VTKEDLPEIGRGDFGANSRGEVARKEETKTISLADLRAIKRFLNSAGLITVEGKESSLRWWWGSVDGLGLLVAAAAAWWWFD
jgi:hypothetical protein